MAENDSVIAAGREWAGQMAPMAIATVVSTWGSAPRPRGSHMLIHGDGRFAGSVSGGCVEADIMATAADVIGSGQMVLRDYGVADGDAWEVGLPCGGQISVLVQPVTTSAFDPSLFDTIAAAREEGRALTVATDMANGASRIVAGDAAAGAFVNRYDPPRRLLIVGAVQIAQALAPLAATLGIAVTVIDPRARFLTAERFPGAVLDDRWPDEAVAAARPGPATAVVTLSHDIKIDDPALAEALRHDTGYIAALGSRRSHTARRERLAAMGFDIAALDRIDGPAGVDIGAVGPAEIALSVAAGMVSAWNGKP